MVTFGLFVIFILIICAEMNVAVSQAHVVDGDPADSVVVPTFYNALSALSQAPGEFTAGYGSQLRAFTASATGTTPGDDGSDDDLDTDSKPDGVPTLSLQNGKYTFKYIPRAISQTVVQALTDPNGSSQDVSALWNAAN